MKKMYTKIMCLFFIMLLMVVTGCGKIDKGYEGALINTIGTDKGEIEVLDTGWQMYNTFKYDIITNPTFVQEYAWTATAEEGSENDESITFQSSNSLAFTADIGISFHIVKGATGKLYEKYHKTIKQLIDTNLRNTVRDAFNRMASQRDAESIYGKGKTEFIKAVENDVRQFWAGYLDIKKIYLLGRLDPPDQVKLAISKKIEATQKAHTRQNEVAEATAAANKEIETAKGKARSLELAADAVAYKITKEATAKAGAILLINKQLSKSPAYIEYIKAKNWDGKLPIYMAGDAPVPFINIK